MNDQMKNDATFEHEKREFTVTQFRRRPSEVWKYVGRYGHKAIITRRTKPEVVIMSIETYAWYQPDPKEFLRELQQSFEQLKGGQQ